VKEAVSEYKSEMDILGQWIEENCDLDLTAQVSASFAYENYKAWASRNGYQWLTANSFGRRLKDRQFKKTKTREGVFYLGFRVKPTPVHGP